jgi:predicted MFS family arabinose efflux permease
LPLCFSVWIQRATPDFPEAGSALFVSIIQVAIAVGSLAGGTIVDRVGIPADFLLGSALALLGLAALASFGKNTAHVSAERLACETHSP